MPIGNLDLALNKETQPQKQGDTRSPSLDIDCGQEAVNNSSVVITLAEECRNVSCISLCVLPLVFDSLQRLDLFMTPKNKYNINPAASPFFATAPN